jgi:hypothetical protein
VFRDERACSQPPPVGASGTTSRGRCHVVTKISRSLMMTSPMTSLMTSPMPSPMTNDGRYDYLEGVASARGGAWLLGDTLTYADIALFQVMAGVAYAYPKASAELAGADAYTRITAIRDAVAKRRVHGPVRLCACICACVVACVVAYVVAYTHTCVYERGADVRHAGLSKHAAVVVRCRCTGQVRLPAPPVSSHRTACICPPTRAHSRRPGIAAYLASPARCPFNTTGIFRQYPELDFGATPTAGEV